MKPRHLLTRPKVSFSLGWAREAVESRGWEFEAWSEPPEAELANVRFLAGYRRAWLFDPELVAEIWDEPVAWQPPASLLDGLDLPGPTPQA